MVRTKAWASVDSGWRWSISATANTPPSGARSSPPINSTKCRLSWVAPSASHFKRSSVRAGTTPT